MTCNKYDITMRYTTLSRELGLKVLYLYTLHIGQHIRTYNSMKVYKWDSEEKFSTYENLYPI